ncbi:TetR family transcriptional regulator [Enterobacter cloacae subsp. cloacae]|uniref:TetR/AcrR family transcriptional regulator n=1 Tax=Enterobacter cloacae TaxID=550 RepID=UPI001C5BA467|nr:TetR family transcriptional regulator [Enterobacter cloacae subsp. cloacae]
MASRTVAIRCGFSALSLSEVARQAGVSKGGLFHHFEDKQTLLSALYLDCFEKMLTGIGELQAADPLFHGRFSRSYVAYIASLGPGEEGRLLASLVGAVSESPELQKMRDAWLNSMLAEASDFDHSAEGALIRLAADGLWLTEQIHSPLAGPHTHEALVRYLTMMTLPASPGGSDTD